MRSLRILLGAIRLGHAGAGGVGAVAVAQASQLFEAGHNVTLIGGDERGAQGLPAPREDGGRRLSIELFPMAGPWNRQLYRAPALGRWLQENIGDFDVVDINGIWSFLAFDIAMACRRHAVPYLLTPHGQMTKWDWRKRPIKKNLFFSLMMRNAWRSAAAIRFVSPDEAARSMISANGKGVVIPNFAPFPPDGDFTAEAACLKRRLSIPETAPIVLFLGRVGFGKGVIELLDAFNLAWQSRRDLVLMIVGAIDGTYGNAVVEKAKSLTCWSGIRFAGPLFGEEKEAAFASASLFALLSKSEGMPIAVLEAMSRGLPVLLTGETNLPQVADYKAGSICTSSPEVVAKSLLDMISDPDRFRQMGFNARRLFAENFSTHAIMPRLLSLYDLVARRKHSAGPFSMPVVYGTSGNSWVPPLKSRRQPWANSVTRSDKLKIAINAISTIHGGAAVALEKLLTEFVELRPNYEFHVIANTTLIDSARIRHSSVRFHFFPWVQGGYIRTSLWYVTALPLWLRRNGIDVLFSHTCYLPPLWPKRSAMLLQDARYFSDAQPLASILTQWELWYFGLKRRWVNYSVRRADEVIVQSEIMAQMVVAKIPQAASRVRVVHHGPGFLDGIEKRRHEDTRVRDTFDIAYVSLYRPYKNFSVLFRALRLLEDRGIRGRLHLTLDATHPDARRLLRDLAKICSPARVINHGVINHAAVADLYRTADVAVFSSVCESFGFPQIEAMALGLPVVASDTPINREVCGPVASYFAPDDEQALASALERLYRQPEERARISNLSVLRAGSFDWFVAAQETLQWLEGESSSS